MKIDSVESLFKQELKDIYDAEKRLTKALPKMAKAASSEDLRQAFQEHLEVTRNQVMRLEEAFRLLGAKAQTKPCAGMKGLIEEGEEIIAQDAEDIFADMALVAAARKVEHYEMAAYRSLESLAGAMENEELQELIQQNLEEEEETDSKLAELAGQLVEEAGSAAEDDMEEEVEEEEEVVRRR
jgi:ferritin-like metal-binding protein YciE